MKKSLITLLLALVCLSGYAATWDFKSDGIYYQIASRDDRTCIVSYNYEDPYSGTITIPDTTVYNGITFKVINIITYCYMGTATSLVIKANWTNIDHNIFYGRKTLTSITLPPTITSIGASAFRNCSNLASINLPEGLTTINSRTFEGCKNLKTVSIPASVTKIGRYAFYDSGITSIDLPENLEDIGDWAFFRAPLKSITIPSGVKWIREHTFSQCRQLTTVKCSKPISAFNGAFEWCTSLVELPPIDWIDNEAFQFCTSLKTVTFYESLQRIAWKAFYHCTSLSHITFPENVTGIDNEAFLGCTSLESVNLSSRVSLGNYVFQDCSKLPTITIPANAGTGYGTFSGCSSLKSVYRLSDNPSRIDIDALFKGCPKDLVIYVPKGSLPLYLITPGWMKFQNYVEFDPTAIASLKTSDDIMVKNEAGVLTISGLNGSEPIKVFDVGGILIGSTTATSGTATVTVGTAKRIVVIKAGEKSLKVKL